MYSFTESYLSDTDNLALFEKYHSDYSDQPALQFFIFINRSVFSNGTMLSVSDKYGSVNEHTHDFSKSMKLYILGVWQNAHEIY